LFQHLLAVKTAPTSAKPTFVGCLKVPEGGLCRAQLAARRSPRLQSLGGANRAPLNLEAIALVTGDSHIPVDDLYTYVHVEITIGIIA
jgi:hypothetical protein